MLVTYEKKYSNVKWTSLIAKERKNYLLSKKQTLGRIGFRRYCELLTLALFLLLFLLLLAFKRFLSLDYLIRVALVKQERLQESKQYLNWSVHSSLTLTKLWTVSLSSGKKMSRSMTRWLQNKNLQHDLKKQEKQWREILTFWAT